MRTWLSKLEAMAAAVAFAEQGEWRTAEGIMDQADRERAQKQNHLSRRQDQRTRKQANYRV